MVAKARSNGLVGKVQKSLMVALAALVLIGSLPLHQAEAAGQAGRGSPMTTGRAQAGHNPPMIVARARAGRGLPMTTGRAQDGRNGPSLTEAAAQTAQAADPCAYTQDRLVALCPSGANSTAYLYGWYNGQWNYVATVWISGNFTYLSKGGITVAKNNLSGQLWVKTLNGWVDITGMSSQAVNNTLATYNVSYMQARQIKVLTTGYTTLPTLCFWCDIP
jgi:hypothetical protein